MSKITLTDVVNLQNENTAVNAINTNSSVIELAFDNTLSRDGASPNQMEASLDMNSHSIINLPLPSSNFEPLRLVDAETLNGAGTINVSPLPLAGNAGQVLTKNTSSNYDVSWHDTHYLANGGSSGQVLTKNTNADYDVVWTAPSPNTVDTIASLRALAPNFASSINVRGYYTSGDGGGGNFYWNASSTDADNNGTIIIPNAGGTGRWMRYFTGSELSVKWFGAKGDGATNDTTNINKAITVAVASKSSVYFPASSSDYLASIVIPDNTNGLKLRGDSTGGYPIISKGSVIASPNNAHTLDLTASVSGSINNIVVENLKLINSGNGTALKVWNVLFSTFTNILTYSANGVGVDVQGSGICTFENVQGYGNNFPALKVGNGAGALTNSGPLNFVGGQYSVQNGTSPAIVIEGDTLGVSFLNTDYGAYGAGVPACITIDGPSSGTPVGSVQFLGCHGESSYNASANTGCDYLIGNTHKFGSVTIDGGNSWGQGDGSLHYQQDFIRVVAARNVTVKNYVTSKLAGTNGYSRSMIRLETTFPNVSASDSYRFENNVYDGSGTLYSDANGRIGGNVDASFNTSLINALNLGNALSVSSGGSGLTAGTSGGVPYYSSSSTQASSAALASNALVVGGGAGAAPATVTTGTGILTALGTNVGSAGAPVILNGALGTPSSGTATNLTGTASGLTAGSVTTNANLTGDVTSVGNATTLTNAPVIAKVLTGYTSGAGTISSADSILSAIQKLNGNDATNANLTGDVTSVGNATTLTNAPVIAKVLTGYTSGAGTVSATDSILQAIQKLNGNDATNANLTGDVTSVGNATTLTNAPVIAKVLTGYTSGAGTVSAADSILSAIQKLNGNDATNANLTGPITSVGNATSIASQTGTGTKLVVDNTPTLITPVLGVATATSINAVTLDNLAWTSYTPTLTSGSGTITTPGTCTGGYKTLGKLCYFWARLVITTNGTGASRIEATLPLTAANSSALSGVDGASGVVLSVSVLTGISATKALIFNSAGVYPGVNGWTGVISGVYETT